MVVSERADQRASWPDRRRRGPLRAARSPGAWISCEQRWWSRRIWSSCHRVGAAGALSSIGCSRPPSVQPSGSRRKTFVASETDACLSQLRALSQRIPTPRRGRSSSRSGLYLVAHRDPSRQSTRPTCSQPRCHCSRLRSVASRARPGREWLRDEGHTDELLKLCSGSTLSPVVVRNVTTLRARLALTSARYAAAATLLTNCRRRRGPRSYKRVHRRALWIAGSVSTASLETGGRPRPLRSPLVFTSRDPHAEAALRRLRELGAYPSAPNRPREDVRMLDFLRRLAGRWLPFRGARGTIGCWPGSLRSRRHEAARREPKALRRNSECVQSAERLRHAFPDAPEAREAES